MLNNNYLRAQNVAWSQTYGGTGDDKGYAVEPTNDGGLVLVGSTASKGAGMKDVYVVKTNDTGDTLWTNTYGGVYNDEAYSIKQTPDSGYIIAGYTNSFGLGSADFFLIKTFANGNVEWTTTSGGLLADGSYTVIPTTDGGYLAFGYTNSNGLGLRDMVAIKFSNTGLVVWNNTYGTTSVDNGYSACQAQDRKGFLLVGNTNHADSQYDIYAVRIDNYGNVLWTKNYAKPGFQCAYGVTRCKLNGYVIVGRNDENNDNSGQMHMLKILDDSGYVVLDKTYASEGDETAYCIKQTQNDGYIIGGINNSNGMKQAAMNHTDAWGDEVWHTVDETTFGSECKGLYIDKNNTVIAVGSEAEASGVNANNNMRLWAIPICTFRFPRRFGVHDLWQYSKSNTPEDKYILLDEPGGKTWIVKSLELINYCIYTRTNKLILGHLEDIIREDSPNPLFTNYGLANNNGDANVNGADIRMRLRTLILWLRQNNIDAIGQVRDRLSGGQNIPNGVTFKYPLSWGYQADEDYNVLTHYLELIPELMNLNDPAVFNLGLVGLMMDHEYFSPGYGKKMITHTANFANAVDGFAQWQVLAPLYLNQQNVNGIIDIDVYVANLVLMTKEITLPNFFDLVGTPGTTDIDDSKHAIEIITQQGFNNLCYGFFNADRFDKVPAVAIGKPIDPTCFLWFGPLPLNEFSWPECDRIAMQIIGEQPFNTRVSPEFQSTNSAPNFCNDPDDDAFVGNLLAGVCNHWLTNPFPYNGNGTIGIHFLPEVEFDFYTQFNNLGSHPSIQAGFDIHHPFIGFGSANIYDGFYWHKYAFNDFKILATQWGSIQNNARPGDHNLVTIDCSILRLQNINVNNVSEKINYALPSIFQKAILINVLQPYEIVANNIYDITIYDNLNRIVNDKFDFSFSTKKENRSICVAAKSDIPVGMYFLHIQSTNENILLNFSK